MRKTDYDFGDQLAGEMEKIMKSAEHQNMFHKQAQFAPSDYGVDVNSPEYARKGELGEHIVEGPKGVGGVSMGDRPYTPGSMAGRGGTGSPIINQDFGASDQAVDMAMLTEKAKKVLSDSERINATLSDPAASYEDVAAAKEGMKQNEAKTMAAQKLLSNETLTEEEKALLKSAQQVPAPPEGPPVTRDEWENMPEERRKDLRKKYPGPLPWEKKASTKASTSESLLKTLVSMANYLGKEGLLVSEAAADRLINTIIVEAAKKGKMKKDKEVEKPCKECKDCKKPLDKCKCEESCKPKDKKK